APGVVLAAEGTAAEQPNAHDLEVARRRRGILRGRHPRSVVRFGAFGGEDDRTAAAVERQRVGGRGGRHAGQRRRAPQGPLVGGAGRRAARGSASTDTQSWE